MKRISRIPPYSVVKKQQNLNNPRRVADFEHISKADAIAFNE